MHYVYSIDDSDNDGSSRTADACFVCIYKILRHYVLMSPLPKDFEKY